MTLELLVFSPRNKQHAMTALANLPKFQGAYHVFVFLQIRLRYSLKLTIIKESRSKGCYHNSAEKKDATQKIYRNKRNRGSAGRNESRYKETPRDPDKLERLIYAVFAMKHMAEHEAMAKLVSVSDATYCKLQKAQNFRESYDNVVDHVVDALW